jgi:hypothetical protein
MTYFKRIIPFILTAALLLCLAPLASAKAPTAANKRDARALAVLINKAHADWTAAYPAVQADIDASSKAVADSCLPAMQAAGKHSADYKYSWASAEIALAYVAALTNPADNRLAPIRNVLIENARKLSLVKKPGNNFSAYYGMIYFDGFSSAILGAYNTTEAVCADANAWRANGFATNKEPRSLARAANSVALTLLYPEVKLQPSRLNGALPKMLDSLRHYGLKSSAEGNMQFSGFGIDLFWNLVDETEHHDPVIHALYPRDGTNSIKAAALRSLDHKTAEGALRK